MSTKSTFASIVAAIVAVLVAVVASLAVTVWRDRENELRHGLREAADISTLLAGQLLKSVEAIDLVLGETQKEIEVRFRDEGVGLQDDRLLSKIRPGLLSRLSYLPKDSDILVIDRNGSPVLSAVMIEPPRVNVGDRENFIELRAHNDGGMSVPVPVTSRIDGDEILILSRRLSGVDRSFQGIITVRITTENLERIYHPVSALPNTNFALLRSDGRFLVRYPDPNFRGGRVPLDSPWWKIAAQGGGFFRSDGIFDGVVRQVSVQRVGEYPLFVHVAVPEAAMLENWRSRTLVFSVFAVSLLGCSMLLLGALMRQYWHLTVSEVTLLSKQSVIEAQNERFDAALNNMHHGIALFDAGARLVVANARYRDIWGFTDAQTKPGRAFQELIEDASGVCVDAADPDRMTGEILRSVRGISDEVHKVAMRDGRMIEVLNRPLSDGGWLSTHEDVTERSTAQTRIERLAKTDLLTGIANRTRFVEEIASAADRLAHEGRPFSVLMFDLDRFKEVNDSLGHAAGDQLLRELVQRLGSEVRSSDLLARLGGDEFAVLQSDPRSPGPRDSTVETIYEGAAVLATRILEMVSRPFDLEGQKVIIGASVGIAVAPKDATTPSELMQRADLALYRVKASGRNAFAFFERSMEVDARERRRLETDLREALQNEAFEMHYQPIVGASDGRLRAAEALIRWPHPERGIIPPDQFITLAEDTGLIIPLGEWIVHSACAEAAEWPDEVKVAVNVSPVQFRKTNLLDVVLCALVDTGLAPERLELEITERVLFDFGVDNLSILHQLKSLGVSIVLDDFGTGYSSLSYLSKFPFDKLKIDRSFAENLELERQKGEVVCAIVNLGRALNMTVVAEGVETETQLRLLQAAGVGQVQGYHIGRPARGSTGLFKRGGQFSPADTWFGCEPQTNTRAV